MGRPASEISEIFTDRCEQVARKAARGVFYPGADADDVLQEARIGVLKAIRDWRPGHEVPFEGFAYMCARRQVITGLKTARRGKHRVLSDATSLSLRIGEDETDGTLADLIPSGIDPERMTIAREQVREMLENARDLTPFERECVNRVLILGEPYDTVGDTKSVDNALQRARRKLDRVPLRIQMRMRRAA